MEVTFWLLIANGVLICMVLIDQIILAKYIRENHPPPNELVKNVARDLNAIRNTVSILTQAAQEPPSDAPLGEDATPADVQRQAALRKAAMWRSIRAKRGGSA